tara:strand:+ start:1148 stop:2245 length:1098 start_codon:yes stop_codon:yes gene_type:complete
LAIVGRRSWWWTWLQVPGVGISRIKQLEQAFGSLQAAWWAPAEQLLALPGVGPSLLAGRDQLQQRASALPLPVPPKVLLPSDLAMPPALMALPQPPAALFWCGRGALWPLLRRQQAIAVIGSRRASPYGCRWAQQLGVALAAAGWPVISGLAEGVDAQAHQGCLEAGGTPIAVLGTSLERVYPRHHQRLQSQVGRRGLLISEQAPGAPGLRGAFAKRNRLLVAMAQAVVLVECPQRSGALLAAQIAWSLQRPLWVVPADSDRASAAGSNGWLNQGATALLDPTQLVEALGPGPLQPLALPQRPDPSPLLSALGSGASFEALQRRLHLSPGALAQQLLHHQQQGWIEALPGLCWRPRHTEIDLPVA